MTLESIGGVVHDYFVEYLLDGDGRDLDLDTDMIGGGLLDSFAVVQLVSFIEERFAIEIPRDRIDAEHFRTIRTVCQIIADTLDETESSRVAFSG